MNRDQDRTRSFTRRAVILGGVQVVLFSALTGRMYYLQVIESEKYKVLAEDNRINLRLLPPPRGRIVDRLGVQVATNKQNYRVIVVAEKAADVERTLERVGAIVELTDYEKRRIMREVKRKRSFIPTMVRENLTWEEVSRLEVNAPDLPGVSIEMGQTRHYPYAEQTAHLIGYVAAVSEKELTGDPLLELPDFRIGKNGIEKTHDLRLRGRAGRSEMEVNAVGRVIRELSRNDGVPGEDIQLTIDMGLQSFAHERFGEESGAAVVMDVTNGEVLALVSTPSFDPNLFSKGISGENWRALLANEKAPLTNKALAGQYPPGSTFKMVVALAALDSGVVTSDHRVFCPGHRDLGNVRFHCWKKGGHGTVDMVQGLMHSCDVYFYDLAQKIGIDRISEMGKRFGLGAQLGIELPGEKPGLMPTRDWKRRVLGHGWSLGETLVAGIGQGFILTTPLQLATMTARIASGKAVTPTLTRRAVAMSSNDGLISSAHAADGFEFASLGLPQSYLAVARAGMNAVSNIPGGTAYNARIKDKGFELAGKTGSAQVKRITMAERATGVLKNEQRPWKDRDHALFVAFAPVDNPRYAIGMIVEHGGGGAAVAAPIARDILLEAQKRDSVTKAPTAKLAVLGPLPMPREP